MKKWADKRQGFTIVELLIVIVVIAILAAITIVAYNGIQNRAKDSSLQSTASQAGKKALAYAPVNADLYPTETSYRSDLSLPADTNSATYNYYTSNDRKTFCLSVANTAVVPEVAFAFTQNGKAVPGRCVENVIANPSFESSVTTPWYNEGGQSVVADTSAFTSGSRSLRLTKTSAGASGNALFLDIPVQTGEVYSFSYNVKRSAGAGDYVIAIRDANSSTYITPGSYATPPAAMTRYRSPMTVLTTGNARLFMRTGTGAVGDAISVDGLMLTLGPVDYSYGDGDSANWSWVGGAGTSVSFGPALPQ